MPRWFKKRVISDMQEENIIEQPEKFGHDPAITQNILFLKTNDVLASHMENLSCEIIDGSNSKNEEIIRKIREIYAESLKEDNILGFSEKIDIIFDPFSYYFVSKKDEEILCFVRLVFKTQKNRLPLEYGMIEGKNTKHVIKENNAVELTTFWAKDFYAFEFLSRKAINFLYNMDVVKVYSTKELGERKLRSVYRRLGLIRGNPQMENIYYPDYGRLDRFGFFKPIIWEIFEGSRSRIEFLSNKIRQKAIS